MSSKRFLYFSAAWCSPCKMFSPVMEEVGQTYPVEKINVDDNPDLANQYNVKSIPTVILVGENNTELWKRVGVTPKNVLISAYDEH